MVVSDEVGDGHSVVSVIAYGTCAKILRGFFSPNQIELNSIQPSFC